MPDDGAMRDILRGRKIASCPICRDTGGEDAGNGDFPCTCGRGDNLFFNTPRGREVGAALRSRYPGVTGGRSAQAAGGPYQQDYQHAYPVLFKQRVRAVLEQFRLTDSHAAALLSTLDRGADPELIAIEGLRAMLEQMAYLRDVATRVVERNVVPVVVMKEQPLPDRLTLWRHLVSAHARLYNPEMTLAELQEAHRQAHGSTAVDHDISELGYSIEGIAKTLQRVY